VGTRGWPRGGRGEGRGIGRDRSWGYRTGASATISSCPRFIENNDIQALSKATFRGLKSLTHL